MTFHCPILATSVSVAIALTACTFSGRQSAGPSGDQEAVLLSRRGPSSDAGEAHDVVAFWKEAGPQMWFAKDPAFDARFRERFARLYERAKGGALAPWEGSSEGTLALLILLDQYPRNSFRDTQRMYATDPLAREVAARAVEAGRDRRVSVDMRLFIYLPFAHSESLADQERSVELARTIGDDNLRHAEHHRDIIRRFGRFPHRNPILGRPMRPEEQKYLDDGGYRG